MNDPLVCFCLRKRRSEVMRAIQSTPVPTLETLMRAIGVGTVCTSCRHDLRKMLSEPSRSIPSETKGSMQPMLEYARHPTARSPYRRFRRFARDMINAWTGKTVFTGNLFFREDERFTTTIIIVNTPHPSYPSHTLTQIVRIQCYGADGVERVDHHQTLAVGETIFFHVRDRVGQSKFGLARVTMRPRFPWQAWRWRIGANRPYMAYRRDGHEAVVHEKTVWFERPFVLPGVVSHPARDTFLCLANVNDRVGEAHLTMTSSHGSETVTLAFLAHGAQVFRLPDHVAGAFIETVTCYANIAFSAYQLTVNRVGGSISLQHLVREGA